MTALGGIYRIRRLLCTFSAEIEKKKKKMSKRKAPSDDSDDKNKNKNICNMLIELADYEKNVNGQKFKYAAYRKAAASIMKHPTTINNAQDAYKLPGVGKKIALKIEEFLAEGKLKKLEKIRKDDTNIAIQQLSRVSGIGPVQARNLLKQGITNINELRKQPQHLTHHQLIGLKYLDDFELRIPRTEMLLFETEIKRAIGEMDSDVLVTICGSYRRGANDSGDVDVLVSHPKFTRNNDAAKDTLVKVVEALEQCGCVTDRLSLGESKFAGVCHLPNHPQYVTTHRRLDIRLIPYDEYFCGLLYYTGSDEFNRQMRAFALDKGFTLNEYGIRKQTKGKTGEYLPVQSEKDIFDYIDMPYKEPHERSL